MNRKKIDLGTSFLMALSAGLLTAGIAEGQSFTKADSGWVRIFNGKDLEGFYSRMYNEAITDKPNDVFKVNYAGTDSATIRVNNTSNQGHLGTDKKYSHYRARVEYKFDATSGNAGFTYHTDEVSARMDDKWPRSIECQMQQGNAGRAYSIAMCTFKTRQTGGNYDPSGQLVEVCEATPNPCNKRDYGASEIRDNKGQWNTMEIVVRGSDSAFHIVNGKMVMKIWNIRSPTSGEDYATLAPHGTGSLALQSEGALVNYRRLEIMELPATGPHFLNRVMVTKPTSSESVTPSTNTTITWKYIGDFKKVKIEYSSAGGAWKVVTESVDNTGSYAWAVPADAGSGIKVRVGGIASEPWVLAGEGGGSTTGIERNSGPNSSSALNMVIQGRSVTFMGAHGARRLDIHDIQGQFVRGLPVSRGDVVWDKKNFSGHTVVDGNYFIRSIGGGSAKTTRILVY